VQVLLVGGTGFIGGRLSQSLSKSLIEVTIATRNIEESKYWFNSNKLVEINWNNSRELELMCEGFDVVLHAAGMNSRDCAADPRAAREFNGFATERLVNAAVKSGVKRFVYLSTSHVYSDPLVGNITEEFTPTNPHPYATSHLQGELAVIAAAENSGIDGRVIRLSNVFGVPFNSKVDCWNLLVNNLCRQAIENNRLVINSRENQYRDFITMTDACEVISTIATEDLRFPLTLNVGSGQSRSILEMANLIQSRCLNVVGFLPEITHEHGMPLENTQNLFFKSIYRNMYNKKLLNNIEAEIDDLLNFCASTFHQKP
jgi:UDP-glucose 4-epimerase